MGEPQLQSRLTISVPEAGRRLGIGRNHAYECARRGELPVIRLGNKLVVPLAAFEAMLADPSRRRRPQQEPAY
jgi:excisionase family DNA binding protein